MTIRDGDPDGTTNVAAALITTLCGRFPRLARLLPEALDEIVRQGQHLFLPAGTRVFDERIKTCSTSKA